MAQVNVTINGRAYRMACDDGEEAHLTALAERLDRSIALLRSRFGEIGDQRLTVMAAITLADQHAEAERAVTQLRAEIAELEDARNTLVERHRRDQEAVAGVVEAMAERVSAMASRVAGAGDESDAG
jgi:cell division protein ZapA